MTTGEQLSQIPGRPLPTVTALNEFFWTAGADGVPANFIAERSGQVVYRVLPNDVPGPAVIREAQEMVLLAP